MDINRFKRKKDDDMWLDWLSDEPPAPPIQTKARQQQARAYTPQPAPRPLTQQSKADDSVKAISINLTLPKINLPKLPYKKIGTYAGAVLLLVGMSFGGFKTAQHFAGNSKGVAGANTKAIAADPSFEPLAPTDKPELASGTNQDTTAFDGQRDVYSYQDQFMGQNITVSQQPLPKTFKDGPEAVKTIGEQLKASESISTAWGDAQIATDSKSQSQTVVFFYRDVLVFIQSPFKRDADSWKYYIENLRR